MKLGLLIIGNICYITREILTSQGIKFDILKLVITEGNFHKYVRDYT